MDNINTKLTQHALKVSVFRILNSEAGETGPHINVTVIYQEASAQRLKLTASVDKPNNASSRRGKQMKGWECGGTGWGGKWGGKGGWGGVLGGGEGGGEDNQLLNQSNQSKALQSFEGTTASQRHCSQSKAL